MCLRRLLAAVMLGAAMLLGQPAVMAQASPAVPAQLPMETKTETASKALRSAVAKDLAKNRYPLEGGGTVNGSDIMSGDGTINNAVLSQVSKSGQDQFAKDLMASADRYTNPSNPKYDMSLAKSSGVSQSTGQDWFKDLRTNSNIGRQMLTGILSDNIYADLSTGSAWFKPFSSPLSSALGFLCIALVGLLGLRAVLDLSYITLPPFQSLANSRGVGGGGGATPGAGSASGGLKLISNHAIAAVQQGDNGIPVWIYFKKAAAEYFFLGLALLFLCFNYIWELVGFFLDFGAGMVGFR